jgi:outer membrane receptor protein involved in Fe transport
MRPHCAAIAGVNTNSVTGLHSAQNALDRLLLNTPLQAVKNPKTGGYAITRLADEKKASNSHPPSTETKAKETEKTSNTMKRKTPIALLTGWIALALAPTQAQVRDSGSPGGGQQSAPATGLAVPTDSSPESSTGPVTLSPFVIEETQETGYRATTTLAGTRLKTPIADLGASISIYTKDLLDDLGATNSNDILIFATGMETAGPGGNYSGATNDINATSVVSEGVRFDPQQTSRTRGLASPNFSRDLFPTRIAFDSYNTDRVTVNRGPNAILFGVGSPAGVVDTSLLRPDLHRNRNKVELRYGNNDSRRATTDINRVLIPKTLGIRLAALVDDERYNQRPAFEDKRRLYGAVAYQPFKSTALRAHFETGRTKANRPITILPLNSSEMWDAAGRIPFDWTFYDDPARNSNAATQNAGLADFIGFYINQGTVQNQMVVVHNNPTDQRPAFGFRSEVPGSAANLANTVRAGTFHPVFNRDLASDIIRFYGTLNIFELPAAYWTGGNVLPGQQPGVIPAGLKQQGFTDFSVFDFKNRMIDESSIQGDSFHTFNIAMEQRAWDDRVGIEVVYDKQRIDRRGKNSFVSSTGSNHVRIDPNVTLPTGMPNPNVGRPYLLSSQVNYNNLFIESDSIRATAFLKYDFGNVRPA